MSRCTTPSTASPAAAVAAAHAVLGRLDPVRAADYDARLDGDLARLRAGHVPAEAIASGTRWGRQVGELVAAARADDGSAPGPTHFGACPR